MRSLTIRRSSSSSRSHAAAVAALAVAASTFATAVGLTAQQTPPAAAGAPAADAQTDNACAGVLADAAQRRTVLGSVPKYRGSYVLVLGSSAAARVPSADAPALKEIDVGLQASTPAADVAKALGLTKLRTYPADPTAPEIADVAKGTLDAAITWAPLAGLAAITLNQADGQLTLMTVDAPRAAPAGIADETPAETPPPCSAAIADTLEANGVLPAELLVSVNIRSLLTRRAPAFDLAAAKRGAAVYAQRCSQCHGADAVAATGALAPVDIQHFVRRFQYAGFLYIVLNGRPQNSMPPLRGTVSEDEVALIYQFVRARSMGALPAAAAPAAPAAASAPAAATSPAPASARTSEGKDGTR